LYHSRGFEPYGPVVAGRGAGKGRDCAGGDEMPLPGGRLEAIRTKTFPGVGGADVEEDAPGGEDGGSGRRGGSEQMAM
jgi:hypothetical protein